MKRSAQRLALPAVALSMLVPVAGTAVDSPLRVCLHVPITGAAPIPHHPARFGGFYFDHVNAELGGIDGRPVEFRAFDDGYYPAGARAAFDRCVSEGADLVLGASGRDEIVTVSRSAERQGVPYLHSSAALEYVGSNDWTRMISPSDEQQMRALAGLLFQNADALAGTERPRIGMVRLSSPYFQAGHDAFVDAVEGNGSEVVVDRSVQKDESQFEDIWEELRTARVEIVNLYVTVNVLIKMLQQKPFGYDPVLASIGPDLGWNIATTAAANAGVSRMIALANPAPVYDESNPHLPWSDEIRRFRLLFDTYSPERQPPADDFDWSFYILAKQIHRMLDAADGDTSREGIRRVLKTYQEGADEASPGCALDFSGGAAASHAWHVFSSTQGAWWQAATCAEEGVRVELDRPHPAVNCSAGVLAIDDPYRCTVAEPWSGIGAYSVEDSLAPGSRIEGDGKCAEQVELEINLAPGVHRLQIDARDCAGRQSSARQLVIST